MWLGVGGVLVDVPWDELGVVAWLSCDCLRLGDGWCGLVRV